MLDIVYVDNSGRKLSNLAQYNYAIAGPGATAANTHQRRILNIENPQNQFFGGAVFGAVGVTRGNANSSYNGMQIQMSRRLAGGFDMSHGYTWSQAMDNASARVLSRPDLAQDRGNSDYDARHNYTASYVYELPFYRQQSGGVGHLLGGWGVSGRTSLVSGAYVTVFEPEPRCLCDTGNVRADATGV